MPVLSKNNELQLDKAEADDGVLKDNDEVFYCELSHKIFRNYEEYFERMMLYNSTVWTCALTSRPNLTYAEALDSERNARKALKNFVYELKAPIVYMASLTKCVRITEMVDEIYNFLHVRYVKEEEVQAVQKKGDKDFWRDCEVLSIIPPSSTNGGSPLNNTLIDPATVKYRVKLLKTTTKTPNEDPWIVDSTQIRRPRGIISRERLKLFLKQCVECNQTTGLLTVKKHLYEKHVIDGGVRKFSDFFIGKPPTYEMPAPKVVKRPEKKTKSPAAAAAAAATDKKPAKNSKQQKKEQSTSKNSPVAAASSKKTTTKDAKQPAISKYFSKDGVTSKIDKNENKSSAVAAVDEKKAKLTNDELIRRRKEREAEAAEAKRKAAEEKERHRQELHSLVLTATRTFNQLRDDLELQDQRQLPVGRPVHTLIPNRHFGNALAVLEFACSFKKMLEDKDKFPRGYTLALLERSLLRREFIGPLSDIVQVLLGTVFSLQIEEENEVVVSYVDETRLPIAECSPAIRMATAAAHWASKYLPLPLTDLPMDAYTVSELLRIHLLRSGAKTDENCKRWRFQQRGGYSNEDDPGLMFCTKYPHILRTLATHTIYQLEIGDILKILNCLICQTLTYPSMRDATEERIDVAQKARRQQRLIVATERKRDATVVAERKAIAEWMRTKLDAFVGDNEADKKALQEKLTKEADIKLRTLEVQSERARAAFVADDLEKRSAVFSYQLLLGTDRAYRSYWLFESLPGIFIEQQPFVGGRCFDNPVENINELAYCSTGQRFNCIKRMVTDKAAGADKENEANNVTKPAPPPPPNGTVATEEGSSQPEQPPVAARPTPTQRELMMCTGSHETCPVHGKSTNHVVWSYLHTEQELDELIRSLNSRGVREKALKEQLEMERDLILDHIKDCPVEQLDVDESKRAEKLKQLNATKYHVKAAVEFAAGTDLTVIAEATLIDSILDLERLITGGHLGTLRVRDVEKWRNALLAYGYDMQCDRLQWGPHGQFNEGKIKNELNGSRKSSTEDKMNNDVVVEQSAAPPLQYKDPGADLGSTFDMSMLDGDLTDSDDDGISFHQLDEERQKVHNYASALLQISQSVEPQFFKPPFGVLKDHKDPVQQLELMRGGRVALEMWSVSLMAATSYSQVFLHLNILNDSIKWARSSLNATCIFCRRRTEPEKMLLCDGCNCGKHLFCFKPKLTKVPDEDWFCDKCKPTAVAAKKKMANKRKIFSITDDELSEPSSDEEEQIEDDGVPVFYKHVDDGNDSDFLDDCAKCFKPGRLMVTCSTCMRSRHLKCTKPPLLTKPLNKNWRCHVCKKNGNRPPAKKFAKYINKIKVMANNEKESDSEDSDSDISDGETKKRSKSRKKMDNGSDAESSGDEDVDQTIEKNNEDDDDDDEEVEEKTKVKAKRPSRGGTKAASTGGRRRTKPKSENESEEEKLRPQRRAAKKRTKHNTTDDDDDDDDFEEKVPKKKVKTSKRPQRSVATVAAASHSDDDDDDDDDDEPLVKPAKTRRNSRRADDIDDNKMMNGHNNGGRKSGTSRRSRRDENDDDDHILLDTVVCYDLLAKIAKHKDAWPFDRPVNKLEVPDYYDVIEQPMDFAKIKSKLNLGSYRTMYDIMNDIQLVFSNCDRYNTSSSVIYNAGVELEKFVYQRCLALRIPFKPSDMIAADIKAAAATTTTKNKK